MTSGIDDPRRTESGQDIKKPLTGVALENCRKLCEAYDQMGQRGEQSIAFSLNGEPRSARIRKIGPCYMINIEYNGPNRPQCSFTYMDGNVVYSPRIYRQLGLDIEQEFKKVEQILSSPIEIATEDEINCSILRQCVQTAFLCELLVECGFEEYVRTAHIVAPDREVKPNQDIELEDDLIEKIERLKRCATDDSQVEEIKFRVKVGNSTYYVLCKEIDEAARFLLAKKEDLNQAVVFTRQGKKIIELYGDLDLLKIILRNFRVELRAAK